MHFCPHHGCDDRGWVGLGNLRANGHPNGGPWRQFHGTACAGDFLATHGTIFHGNRADPQQGVWAVAALAEGLSIRAVARVFEVDPHTVLAWLVEAAAHLQAFSRHFLRAVQVTQVQLDELFARLSAVKDGTVTEAEAMQRLSRAPHWVWVAIDPVTKLLLTADVGDRTRAMAQRVVHQVAQVVAPDCAPDGPVMTPSAPSSRPFDIDRPRRSTVIVPRALIGSTIRHSWPKFRLRPACADNSTPGFKRASWKMIPCGRPPLGRHQAAVVHRGWR